MSESPLCVGVYGLYIKLDKEAIKYEAVNQDII